MHFLKGKGEAVDGVVLSGDFNLPNIDWKSHYYGNDYESMFLEMVMDTKMEQIVDFCTRGANVLDLILVSGRISPLKIEPHLDSPCPSDHRAVGAMLECELKTKLQVEQKAAKFSFCKADCSVINEFITSHPFQPICWSNANILVEQWTEWTRDFIAKHVPITTRHRAALPPWVLSSTSNLLRRLETVRRRYEDSQPKSQKLTEQVERLLLEDRQEYESKLSESRNTQNLFKHFRRLKKHALPPTMILNDKDVSTDAEKAEAFNRYFGSVYGRSSTWSPAGADGATDYSSPTQLCNFSITHERLRKSLHDNDPSKSGGIDEIPGCFVKEAGTSLCHSLVQVVKKVRQTCIYPSPWKTALVAPVKKGDRRDVRNYRPVSLLPVSSKLLEKCIFMDLYDFVRPKFNNLQFGFRFRRNRSAVSQMLVYLDKVYKALDRDEHLEVFYTDFEKAFDKIDHAKILKKLWNIGVRGGRTI